MTDRGLRDDAPSTPGQEADADDRRGRPADLPGVDVPAGRASASRAAATTTRARSTRRAPPSSAASPRSRAPSTASRSPRGWRRPTPCCARCARAGDHVVIPDDAYGGTFRLVDKVLGPWGLDAHAGGARRTSRRSRAAMRPGATRLVWVETPTNPMLRIATSRRSRGSPTTRVRSLVVDNTFATPYLQQPIALGADVVVHSTTKYLGGHSDVVGGAARHERRRDRGAARACTRTRWARSPGPFDAWLVLRGVRTLALRMERHCDNAEAVVASARPRTRGSPRCSTRASSSHPGHEVARAPDAPLRRDGELPRRRRPRRRRRGVQPRAPLHARRVARRRRVADRACRSEMTHQSVDGLRPRGARGPRPAVRRDRVGRRPRRRPRPARSAEVSPARRCAARPRRAARSARASRSAVSVRRGGIAARCRARRARTPPRTSPSRRRPRRAAVGGRARGPASMSGSTNSISARSIESRCRAMSSSVDSTRSSRNDASSLEHRGEVGAGSRARPSHAG